MLELNCYGNIKKVELKPLQFKNMVIKVIVIEKVTVKQTSKRDEKVNPIDS